MTTGRINQIMMLEAPQSPSRFSSPQIEMSAAICQDLGCFHLVCTHSLPSAPLRWPTIQDRSTSVLLFDHASTAEMTPFTAEPCFFCTKQCASHPKCCDRCALHVGNHLLPCFFVSVPVQFSLSRSLAGITMRTSYSSEGEANDQPWQGSEASTRQ